MKSCVVRVFGPAVAKVRVPGLLLCVTGSSLMFALLPGADSPPDRALRPNWTMKPGTTRKNGAPVKKPCFDEIVEAVRAERSPCAIDLHDEIALRRGEFHFVDVRRFRFQLGRVQQSRISCHVFVLECSPEGCAAA